MAWLSGWTYRQKITIDADTYISSSLTDFTVAVNVPSSRSDFWANVKSDGTDVRFALLDGTLLKFEIESFDNTGDDAWYHVKIPTLSHTANTDIYLYYGNAGASDGSDRENTWDTSFSGVWHLNTDKTEGAMDDSTSNNNDGTNTGAVDVAGQIDRGWSFDGVDDKITVADSTSLDMGSGDFTIEGWAKVASGETGVHGIFSKGINAQPFTGYMLYMNEGDWEFNIDDGIAAPLTADLVGSYNDDTFHHLFCTFEETGEIIRVNLDGGTATVQNTGTGLGAIDNNKSLFLGVWREGTQNFCESVMDEWTISKGVRRSDDWGIARYRSGLGAWLTFSAQETESVPATGDGRRGIGRGIMRGIGRGL